jgi:hypothetical protein
VKAYYSQKLLASKKPLDAEWQSSDAVYVRNFFYTVSNEKLSMSQMVRLAG